MIPMGYLDSLAGVVDMYSVASYVMTGGRPCSLRTAKHSRMAAATFDSASAAVRPWLTPPGTAGHSAMNTPSSS